MKLKFTTTQTLDLPDDLDIEDAALLLANPTFAAQIEEGEVDDDDDDGEIDDEDPEDDDDAAEADDEDEDA